MSCDIRFPAFSPSVLAPEYEVSTAATRYIREDPHCRRRPGRADVMSPSRVPNAPVPTRWRR